jgi:hypothetical protein
MGDDFGSKALAVYPRKGICIRVREKAVESSQLN